MTADPKAEFIRALFIAYEVLADGAGRDLNDDRIKAYCRIIEIENVDYTAATKAVASLLAKVKFFPKPVEIVEEVRGSVADRAELACSEVIRLAARGTEITPADLDVYAAAAVAEMGGWNRFKMMTDRERPFVTREFEAKYAMLSRQPIPVVLARLPRSGAAGPQSLSQALAQATKQITHETKQ